MHKITVYLKSGATIEFNCIEFEVTRSNLTSDYTSYSIKGLDKTVSFNIAEIAAYVAEEVPNE